MNIVILWEFASAITPGIVGGTAVALGIISQEKKHQFREVYRYCYGYLIPRCSILRFMYPYFMCSFLAFHNTSHYLLVHLAIRLFFLSFLTTYSLFLGWVVIVHFGLFIKPKLIGTITKKIFSIPVLRKFSSKSRTMEQ